MLTLDNVGTITFTPKLFVPCVKPKNLSFALDIDSIENICYFSQIITNIRKTKKGFLFVKRPQPFLL
jgi:hypothetical protein